MFNKDCIHSFSLFQGDLVPYLYKQRKEGEVVESKDAVEQQKARQEEEEREKQENEKETETGFVYSLKFCYTDGNLI